MSVSLLTHLVVIRFTHTRQLALKINFNGEVKVPLVSLVGFNINDAVQFLACLHRQVVVEVEYCLLPVSVPGLGCC